MTDALSDMVQQVMERMITGVKDLESRNIISEQERQWLIRCRRDFEYTLVKRSVSLSEFKRAIAYEKDLAELISRRKSTRKITKGGVGEHAVTQRIQFLYQRCMRKFPENVDMWLEFFAHGKKHKSAKTLHTTLARAIQHHPSNVDMWRAAADFERDNGNWSQARSLLLRAVRNNGGNPKVAHDFYIEYILFELDYAKMLDGRRRALGLDEGEEDQDPWGCAAAAAAPVRKKKRRKMQRRLTRSSSVDDAMDSEDSYETDSTEEEFVEDENPGVSIHLALGDESASPSAPSTTSPSATSPSTVRKGALAVVAFNQFVATCAVKGMHWKEAFRPYALALKAAQKAMGKCVSSKKHSDGLGACVAAMRHMIGAFRARFQERFETYDELAKIYFAFPKLWDAGSAFGSFDEADEADKACLDVGPWSEAEKATLMCCCKAMRVLPPAESERMLALYVSVLHAMMRQREGRMPLESAAGAIAPILEAVAAHSSDASEFPVTKPTNDASEFPVIKPTIDFWIAMGYLAERMGLDVLAGHCEKEAARQHAEKGDLEAAFDTTRTFMTRDAGLIAPLISKLGGREVSDAAFKLLQSERYKGAIENSPKLVYHFWGTLLTECSRAIGESMNDEVYEVFKSALSFCRTGDSFAGVADYATQHYFKLMDHFAIANGDDNLDPARWRWLMNKILQYGIPARMPAELYSEYLKRESMSESTEASVLAMLRKHFTNAKQMHPRDHDIALECAQFEQRQGFPARSAAIMREWEHNCMTSN